MDLNEKNNESEMGSGDSDDEFFNVKLSCTPEIDSERTSKKIQVNKVYSPPRSKVHYDYKFESSSDEESETKNNKVASQPEKSEAENTEKKFEEKEESLKENKNLSQSTFKVVEKINEELKTMKNSGTKSQTEKLENLNGQNHIAASVAASINVPRAQIGVVPPVVVVPQASVMAPVIVPSAIGMGGPMAMMSSQNMMGGMLRGHNAIGLASGATASSMMGMSAMPGMMGMQGNIMGMAGGMINPAAMSGISMGMAGNLMRMPSASNPMFRMQTPGSNVLANNMMGIPRPSNNLVGVPRPVNIPPPPSNLIVNNPMLASPGGLMVMSPMMSPVMGPVMGNTSGIINNTVPATNQTGTLVGNSNVVRMVNSSQGNLSVRLPPPPPFLNLRGRPPAPPGNFRWQSAPIKLQSNTSNPDSPTASSPGVPSRSSSPLDKASRNYDCDELSRDEKERTPSIDTDESQSQSPPRELPNTFKNDGSFMEMFKKMTEESENNQEATSSNDKSGNSETSDSSSALKKPAVILSGIVGKRRGGRVLKTGLVKKVKKGGEAEEEKHPKDAWSMYMAEVKKYREASCEEEGKTRPLVK